MKNKIWLLFASIMLLTWIILPGAPAVASNSSVTVSGTVPLVITAVKATGISDHCAVISWETNGKATSQVFYDTVSHANLNDYHYHVLDNTPVSEHSIALSGLLPSTTYHYVLKSTTGGNNLVAVSAEFTFKTLSAPAPTVTTLYAFPVCGASAFLWGMLDTKGHYSPSVVYFQWGKTTSYGFETSHQYLMKGQTVFIALATPLKNKTIYHFRAVAVVDGISYFGKDMTF